MNIGKILMFDKNRIGNEGKHFTNDFEQVARVLFPELSDKYLNADDSGLDWSGGESPLVQDRKLSFTVKIGWESEKADTSKTIDKLMVMDAIE